MVSLELLLLLLLPCVLLLLLLLLRHWRLTGIAHELRGSAYVSANMSLLSTAYGRTKEFKDR